MSDGPNQKPNFDWRKKETKKTKMGRKRKNNRNIRNKIGNKENDGKIKNIKRNNECWIVLIILSECMRDFVKNMFAKKNSKIEKESKCLQHRGFSCPHGP